MAPASSGDSQHSRRYLGRRLGRAMRPARAAALDALSEYGITLEDDWPAHGSLTPAQIFGPGYRETWLEIGFGNGEHLLAHARRHPDIAMIGAEPFLNGTAALLKDMLEEGLQNIRVLPSDVRPLLDALPGQCINRAFCLFSDPWPKKRHEDRRVIRRETLDQLFRIMKPGAALRVATDDPTLQEWTIRQLWQHEGFAWTAETAADWRIRPDDWPPTRYEEKAIAAGRRPIYLTFLRRETRAGGV